MKKSVLIFLFLLLVTNVKSQTGFLGKRFSLGVGTALNTPILNKYYRNDLINTFYDFSVLPPKVEGEIGYVLTERFHLCLRASYMGVQNSGFAPTTSDYNQNTYIQNTYIDSFKMGTNVLDLGLNLKFFQEYAPVGKYFMLGMGYSRATSTVYPTYAHVVQNVNTGSKEIFTTKITPGVTIYGLFNFSLGFGKTKLLTRNTYIDYGMKSTFYLGTFRIGYNYQQTYSYKPNFDTILNYIITNNLQSSNTLEFYVKLGFSH